MAELRGMSQCSDFLQFQTALKQARQIDDKIVYALNNSVPTASFKGQVDATAKCKELHQKIQQTYCDREKSLNKCVEFARQNVESAKAANDYTAVKSAQLNLRLYRNELSFEDVIKARTTQIFHTKCRDHYQPDV